VGAIGFEDYWDEDSNWDYDDNLSSPSGVKVLFVDPGGGIGRHPGIEIQGVVFLMTSQQKRRGESGYIEIPEGEGGLKQTSFVNLNERFGYDSCTIQFDLDYLSVEITDEIYSELNRLHPDIVINNQSNDEDDDDWNYHNWDDY
jgi:hypothetical protein